MELLKKILRYYKPYRFGVIGTLILVTLSQVLLVCEAYFFGRCMDAIVTQHDFARLLYFAKYYGGTVLIQNTILMYILEEFRNKYINHTMPNDSRYIAERQYLSMSHQQLTQQNSLLSLTMIREGIDAVCQFEANLFYAGIPLVTYTLAMLTMLAITNVIFFGIVIIVITIFGAETIRLNKHIIKDLLAVREESYRVRGKQYSEQFKNSTLIKINAQEEEATKEFHEKDNRISQKERKIWSWYSLSSIPRSSLLVVNKYTMIVLGGYLVLHPQGVLTIGVGLTAGSLMMIYNCLGSIYSQLWSIGHIIRQAIKQHIAMQAFFQFLELNPSIVSGTKKLDLSKPPEVKFNNVSYSYKTAELSKSLAEEENEEGREPVAAIRNINLTIEAGKRYGIVGESGVGKTTIIKLMYRFDDPDSGEILINGINIRDLHLKEYLHAVGYVLQSQEIFDESFRKNILFAVNGKGKSITDESIMRLCNLAGIDDVIDRYRNGLDARVGERGGRLSGGQLQRLNLARTLLKEPIMLILDEATSALDSENEAKIQDLIREASTGRTTIIIAHRLSTLRFVDQIIVMRKATEGDMSYGEIADTGTHDELMQRCEIYKQLVSKQTFVI